MPTRIKSNSKTSTQFALRFLALGDSYTIGEGLPPEASWPVQLVAKLRAEGVTMDDPILIAQTGWTTGELLSAIQTAMPDGDFDLVSLSIGVNNQYRGLSVNDYAEEFTDLLELAIGFAGSNPSHVLVLSIPDWGVTPFAQASGRDIAVIAQQIDSYNQVKRSICLQYGVHWLDVTGHSRQGGASLLASDGLHPSAEHYGLWLSDIAAIASLILGK